MSSRAISYPPQPLEEKYLYQSDLNMIFMNGLRRQSMVKRRGKKASELQQQKQQQQQQQQQKS